MKIPKNILDEIEQRSNIVDVIGSYVTLQKAGGNFKGLCPFHNEKTASFTVYPSSNSFYCFGCGAGGGVFSFIMKAENLDFAGAAELLSLYVPSSRICPNRRCNRRHLHRGRPCISLWNG